MMTQQSLTSPAAIRWKCKQLEEQIAHLEGQERRTKYLRGGQQVLRHLVVSKWRFNSFTEKIMYLYMNTFFDGLTVTMIAFISYHSMQLYMSNNISTLHVDNILCYL